MGGLRRRGAWEGRAQWCSKLREECPTKKTHDVWYLQSSRPRQRSPPPPPARASASVQVPDHLREFSTTTEEVFQRMKAKSCKALANHVPEDFGPGSRRRWRREEARCTSAPASATRVAWSATPPEATPGEAMLRRMMSRTASTFAQRHRRIPVASFNSTSPTPACPRPL